jgi:hypothetical protein
MNDEALRKLDKTWDDFFPYAGAPAATAKP